MATDKEERAVSYALFKSGMMPDNWQPGWKGYLFAGNDALVSFAKYYAYAIAQQAKQDDGPPDMEDKGDLFGIYFPPDHPELIMESPKLCDRCGALVAKHLAWEHIVWHSKLEV